MSKGLRGKMSGKTNVFYLKMGVCSLAFSFKVLFTRISVNSKNKDKTKKHKIQGKQNG